MKFYFVLLVLSCLSCAQDKQEIAATINLGDKTCVYTIVNTDTLPIFIPEEYYYVIKIADSIIFEAIYKPQGDEIAPLIYSFPPPKMLALRKSTFTDTISLYNEMKDEKSNYYFRVYHQDFQSYLDDIHFKYEPYVTDFLEYEKVKSVLIKANKIN